MKKNIILFLVSFTLFACTDAEEIIIPDHIIPENKMAEIFVDVHILEATLNINAGSVGKDTIGRKLNLDIFKKHNITKAQYEESYKFYTENPDALMEVYDIVLQELSKLQASVGQSK
jgi:hypothetical protein